MKRWFEIWVIRQVNRMFEIDVEELISDHELLQDKYENAQSRISELVRKAENNIYIGERD